MARNTLKLDTSAFERLLIDIEALGGNVKEVSGRALRKAALQIQNDTVLAVSKPKLPAQGKYSDGYTAESVVHFAKVEWDGNVGWIPVGFDFSKPGSGGYLISGTPRMNPDVELRKMYKNKRYMSEIQKIMQNEVWDELKKLWGV